LAAAEQARQGPSHGESQQTPSTQKPLLHALSALQEAPWTSCSTQAPALVQKKPSMQSEDSRQEVAQASSLAQRA
jgi:hypothetical protein